MKRFSAMQVIRLGLVAATTALLTPLNAGAIQSARPEFLTYMDVPFHKTTLQTLQDRFGESPLFEPPGEVLVPREVCYHAEGGPKATFFVEHYGRQPGISTVIGVALWRNASDDREQSSEPPTCTAPKVPLSSCIGKICLGDSVEHVKQSMSKEMTYPRSYEWSYVITLSPGDLVLDAHEEREAPDWMYPSHKVRVRFSDGVVSFIYAAVHIDMT